MPSFVAPHPKVSEVYEIHEEGGCWIARWYDEETPEGFTCLAAPRQGLNGLRKAFDAAETFAREPLEWKALPGPQEMANRELLDPEGWANMLADALQEKRIPY